MGFRYLVHSSDGSGQSVHIHRLARAFAARIHNVRMSDFGGHRVCQDTTCIFNSLAGGRVAIVTMHSLRRLIHWTVTMFL